MPKRPEPEMSTLISVRPHGDVAVGCVMRLAERV